MCLYLIHQKLKSHTLLGSLSAYGFGFWGSCLIAQGLGGEFGAWTVRSPWCLGLRVLLLNLAMWNSSYRGP